jgi:hypothetical protein
LKWCEDLSVVTEGDKPVVVEVWRNGRSFRRELAPGQLGVVNLHSSRPRITPILPLVSLAIMDTLWNEFLGVLGCSDKPSPKAGVEVRPIRRCGRLAGRHDTARPPVRISGATPPTSREPPQARRPRSP